MRDLFQGRNTVPVIFQAELNECGLACLAMIAGYYGKRIDIRTLRNSFSISAAGASVKHVLQAAAVINLQGRPLKLELSDLTQLSLPVILHWDLDHFVVLKKANKRSVVIHDPAVGVRKYKRDEIGIHFTGIAIEFSPQQNFTKENLAPGFSLKELFQATPSFYRAIVQVFFLSLLIQLLALLSPLFLQLVIDQGLGKGDMDLVFLLAIFFFLAVIAKTLISFFRGVILLQFSNQLGFQLVGNTFNHLLRLPLSYFEKRDMGDIVSRFSSLENIKQLVTQEMITVLVDGLFSLITLALLFLYSPMLAFIAIGFVALFTVIRFAAVPIEKSRRQELLVANAKQQSRFMENIRSVAVTKNYAIEQQRLTDWQSVYAEFINSGYHLGHFQLSIVSVQGLIFGLDQLMTIYLGATLVLEGELTIGQLMSYIFLKQHFTSSIAAMLPKLAEIRLMKLELERVADITLQTKEECSARSGIFGRDVRGKLEVKNLCFSYSDVESLIINNVSFSVASGETLVITGKSGSGKSTLLKLLMGLEKPRSGEIMIDDIALCDFGIKNFREQTATIMHGDVLLSGDLAYNINLDMEPYNAKRLKTACLRAGIYDMICSLPMGFNTHVGEMGNRLSAGQVQRVLLARALYRLPRILILDEAMSHLSGDMAKGLLEEIKRLNITLIVVTHSPALVDLADVEIQL